VARFKRAFPLQALRKRTARAARSNSRLACLDLSFSPPSSLSLSRLLRARLSVSASPHAQPSRGTPSIYKGDKGIQQP
jgi:hypothetical protein